MNLTAWAKPPFRSMGIIVYGAALLGLTYAPDGLVQSFRLTSSADYAGAVAATSGGGSFFDAFNGLLLWPLRSFLPPFESALALSLIVSLFLLAALLAFAPHLSAGLLPGRRRKFSTLFVLFMPALFAFFAPGAIGAAPYALLAFGFALACLLRPVRARRTQMLWLGAAFLGYGAHSALAALVFDKAPLWNAAFFFKQAFLPSLGLIGALFLGLGAQGARRWRFWVLLIVQIALAGRAVHSLYALALWQMTALPSLTSLFFALYDRAARLRENRRYVAELALFLIMTLIPVGLIPAALNGKAWMPDVFLAPFVRDLPACALRGAALELKVATGVQRVLNQPDLTDELRLRAPGHVFLPSEAFFAASNEDVAQDIVKKLQIDYVFACAANAPPGSLLARLKARDVPSWLLPMGLVFDGQTLLYKVKKDQL